MRIKMIEVGSVTKEKTYFVLPIKYEEGGKQKDKKIFSFNETAYKALKDSKAGDEFEVGLKKDNNGYWQWDSVGTAGAGSVAAPARSGGGFVESADRQKSIVRQSCLAQAVAFVTAAVNGPDVPAADIEEVLVTAKAFEDWVNRE